MTASADTGATVEGAEREAQDAQQLLDELERRVVDGDDTVSHEQITEQASLSRFARLRVEATKRAAERAATAAAIEARKALAAEMKAKAPALAGDLKSLLRAVDQAARAFDAAVAEHDEQVGDWIRRADVLDVPRQGVPSPEHEGLGLSAVGDVIAGSVKVARLDAGRLLNLLFAGNDDPTGRLIPSDQRRDLVYALLDGLATQ